MKLLYLISILILSACNYYNAPGHISKSVDCKVNYDTVLDKYARSFEPVAIGLNSSLSPGLNLFLLNVDTNCLRHQTGYKFFIISILSKLYYFHLKCCNQGYDLQSMTQEGAGIMIHEFKHIAGYDKQKFEMINSSTVVDFIEKDSGLKQTPLINIMLKNIKAEAARIDKGNL